MDEDFTSSVEEAVARGVSRAMADHVDHAADHEWIRQQRAKTEFWNDLRRRSIPGIFVALVTGVCAALWQYVQAHWK